MKANKQIDTVEALQREREKAEIAAKVPPEPVDRARQKRVAERRRLLQEQARILAERDGRNGNSN